MSKKGPVIALDGPAGSGKSTVAKLLAQRLGCTYIDSGAMYRAVGLAARRAGADPGDEQAVVELLPSIDIRLSGGGEQPLLVELNGEDVSEAIRTPGAGNDASAVARYQMVREHLVALQQKMGADGSVVMDGRDIGTVVFPDADVKLYLDASIDERARRRYEELKAKGIETDYQSVFTEMTQRDKQDSLRQFSPLTVADGAVKINTVGKTITEVVGIAF